MISINKILKLFTWHTLEVLAIGTSIATSLFAISNIRKQDREIRNILNEMERRSVEDVTDANNYDKKLLYLTEDLLTLCKNQSEKISNKTKYSLEIFKKELEKKLTKYECFKQAREKDKSQNDHYQNPWHPHEKQNHRQQHKNSKPQPLG